MERPSTGWVAVRPPFQPQLRGDVSQMKSGERVKLRRPQRRNVCGQLLSRRRPAPRGPGAAGPATSPGAPGRRRVPPAAPGSAATSRSRMAPSSGTSESRVTSAASRDTVAQPAGVRQFGQRRGERQPGADPHGGVQGRADDGGEPGLRHDVQGAPHSPSGATFTTIRSAAPARATLSGSSSLRTLSSAAISTGIPAARSRRRTSARPAMSGTGCSAYSSPTADSRVSASTAAGTSQPPFASTRIAASGSASRTAATRAASSSRLWPRSATLILTASTRPKRARISGTRSAAMAGTVALTGMLVTQRRREALPAGLDGGGKPAGGFGVAVLGERAEFPPAQRAREQQGLALQDARGTSPASAGSPRGRRPGARPAPGAGRGSRRDGGAGLLGMASLYRGGEPPEAGRGMRQSTEGARAHWWAGVDWG